MIIELPSIFNLYFYNLYCIFGSLMIFTARFYVSVTLFLTLIPNPRPNPKYLPLIFLPLIYLFLPPFPPPLKYLPTLAAARF